MDTDALRRAWPDVLGKIFEMRRATWTFVSQHAQVLGYDGRTLTLGIGTVGLTNTFRSGNHAEIVRQALIDQLGVDAIVDGVPMPEGGATSAPVAPPPGAVPASLPDDTPPPRDAGRPESPGGAVAADPRASAPPAKRSGGLADAGLSPTSGRSLEDKAGWGSGTSSAPDWATASAAPAPDWANPAGDPAAAAPSQATAPAQAGATDGGDTEVPAPTAAAVRGASAVRQSLGAARRAPAQAGDQEPAAPFTDDSAVSADDEDIEVSTDVGRGVIEKVLGGRVISEDND